MRYKILKESASGHCCFDFTVIDTDVVNKSGCYDWLCECFEEEGAIRICESLNGGSHEFADTDRVAK